MKQKLTMFLVPLGIAMVSGGCVAAPQPSAPKVLLAQNTSPKNAQKIAQVKAGTLKTANASWWGFDSADATECLQNAINSGVPKLIVDNAGSDWIIGKPLNLVSNQQIIFADGVVIQAKKDAFKGTKDSLFNGENLHDIALIGEGKVVFRMRRTDYANPKLYQKAEWRHGINLLECKNVIIRGITVTETGGDGLYLGSRGNGYNENVLVENMIFDSNYRQGLSVISADGLTIRNSKFLNTAGTAPQAGIDFEPNQRGQRISNCVIENSEFVNNKGSGVEIALMQFDHTTSPVSVTVKNSLIKGNAIGLAVNPAGKNTTEPVSGKVLLEGCTLVGDRINLSSPVAGAIDYVFKNSTIDFSEQKKDDWQVPVSIGTSNPAGGRPIGGVTFDNLTVLGNVDEPVSLSYQDKATISDAISGDIYLKNNGQTKKYDLANYVKKKQAEYVKLNQLIPAVLDLQKLEVPENSEKRTGNNTFYLRNDFAFLQYAQKGETVNINITSKRIYSRKATIKLLDPNGKIVEVYDIPAKSGSFPISFTATESGFYQLVRSGGSSNYTDINSSYPGNGILTMNGQIQFLPTEGNLYFQVPAGVKEFTIGVAGSPLADVALVDPSGKEVDRQPELNSLHLFSATRPDDTKSEIWSIHVRKAVWGVTVKPYAPLAPIVSTNPSTMLLVKN